MSTPRPNKERVNISVNPQVHGRFSQLAERNSQSVSGILNDLMIVYCGPSEADDDSTASPQVIQRLRQTLMVSERTVLQRVVRRIAIEAGLEDIDLDESDPTSIVKIPEKHVTEWIGQVAKIRTGVRLTFNLAQEPDIALGQSLMFRGASKCERVILVVPCRLGVSQSVIHATEQAGLEVCGVDALESLLRQRVKRDDSEETPDSDGRKRVRDAAKELERMKTRRKRSSAKASKQPA
ncbi:MAG: hypothetical protein K1X78_17830 [Verrucomicrobiaceae bacterium]|nr:hypothetical protein [Verrucomicrobiaceae bacterium]